MYRFTPLQKSRAMASDGGGRTSTTTKGKIASNHIDELG
jgi:hypothetical protein